MDMPLLLRGNIRHSKAGVEYTPIPIRLPRTLKDAMKVTRGLGYNYIWIDALCIIQDDPYDLKYSHLHNMDAVYSCAALTIAAGSGNDADYGLPGVGRLRKFVQYSEKIDGIRLATMFPSFSDVENSGDLFWNTRGWTLQEKLLSKRLLLFTDYQVYFKCAESIWTEEINMETGQLSSSVEARPSKYRWVADREVHEVHGWDRLAGVFNFRDVKDKDPHLGFLPNYVQLVENYSTRSLSDPRDYLFAVEGLLRTIDEVLFSGIPQQYFHKALLWRCNSVPEHKTLADNVPSWSWAFHMARKFWDTQTIEYTFSTLNVPVHLKDIIIDDGIHDFLRPAESVVYCTKGRFKKVKPDSEIEEPWRQIPHSMLTARALAEVNETPGLWISTAVVRLKIGAQLCERKCHRRVHWYELLDWKGRCCGEVWLAPEVAESRRNRNQDFVTLSWGRRFHHERLFIDTAYRPVQKVTKRLEDGKEEVQERQQPYINWVVANVLLITPLNGGVSRRLGVGKVILTAWIQAHPEKVSVLLG
ncbi:HET-domain-containing protein [Rhizodiscina lignyota]|uniref:HET-domain-containing protein n=1 Tax=Rhizodiscina lignyota TaxID=1504668 RepID=A0A9P4MCK2_9PEZI|nr:HET-domain-containing protein [Rhizodiscina lignyota]